jgi:TRAP-type uncharacterized transport system substrate-binding protein
MMGGTMSIRFTFAAAVAGALAFAAPMAKAEEFINILTGGTSGVYYPMGVALSEIYAKGIEGRARRCRPPRPRSRT